MGQVHASIHAQAAIKLRDALGLKAFVETGTYHGVTVQWAIGKFEKITSMDISDSYVRSVRNKISHPSVTLLSGDSRDLLPAVCNGLIGVPTLFWLDAHYVGENTTFDPKGNPLLEEIEIINSYFYDTTHAIMIDDYWLFVKDDSSPLYIPLRDAGRANRKTVVSDDVLIAARDLPEF